LDIPVTAVKELREKCGGGVMECRTALVEAEGDIDKAMEILEAKSLVKAQKRSSRETSQGIIDTYIHQGRIGALIMLNCETDFVAKTDEFKELAHNIAMQVAAQCPRYLSVEDAPEGTEVDEAECLLTQPFIKDPQMTVKDLVTATIAKTGENIKVGRFARFELGE
jgi:elongation factor Ts